jgi:glycosyltransferase involved in cell wall biosynthesis
MKIAEKRGALKIGVITYPFGEKTKPTLLLNLLEILESIADKLYVITGNIPPDEIPNNIRYHLINFKMEKELRRHLPMYIAFPIWLFNYIMGQIKMSYNLLKISKNVDIVIFFLGWSICLLPILSARILKKKVVIIVTGSEAKSTKESHAPIFGFIQKLSERVNYTLSNYVIPESESLIYQLKLERYKSKVFGTGSRFVDISFKIKKSVMTRKNKVGYIGRFSKEKGIMNFVEAIPLVLKESKNIDFLIGGNGVLFGEIGKKIRSYHNKVILKRWIPHEKLPDYLNELKLLVLPSHSEGLPTMILEAMACGTPVLATPVGGIPDVIKDGETGFIMENNLPVCIAENVMRALNYPNIDEIIRNARNLIEEEYTYEAAVDRYKKIFEHMELGGSK